MIYLRKLCCFIYLMELNFQMIKVKPSLIMYVWRQVVSHFFLATTFSSFYWEVVLWTMQSTKSNYFLYFRYIKFIPEKKLFNTIEWKPFAHLWTQKIFAHRRKPLHIYDQSHINKTFGGYLLCNGWFPIMISLRLLIYCIESI